MQTDVRWDRRFMALAREVSRWSKDPSTKIGVVLVKNRRVIATGYNGFPPGLADDSRLHDRELKYRLTVHAELNALLQAGQDARGATLYLYGFSGPPCHDCTKHVIAAGIERVVVCGLPTPERWADSLKLSQEMLDEVEVPVVRVDMSKAQADAIVVKGQ